jgi:hypothetical protein
MNIASNRTNAPKTTQARAANVANAERSDSFREIRFAAGASTHLMRMLPFAVA